MIENKKVVPRDKSIRLNLLISNSDIGFEALYQQLVQFKTNGQRSKFVKTFLHDICVGLPVNFQPFFGEIIKTTQSLRVDIRFSKKEIGFESLHTTLHEMKSTFERNQHVRRMAFNSLNKNFPIEKKSCENSLQIDNSDVMQKIDKNEFSEINTNELIVLSESDLSQKNKDRERKRKKIISEMLQ